MSPSEISISFGSGSSTCEAGSTFELSVQITPGEHPHARELQVTQIIVAHGKGDRDEGTFATCTHALGALQPGQPTTISMQLTAPAEPVSYAGNYVQVRHLLRVVVVGDAAPVVVELDYVVAPGPESAAAYRRTAVQQAGGGYFDNLPIPSSKVWTVFGVAVLIVISPLLLALLTVAHLATLPFAIAFKLKQLLAYLVIGRVQVDFEAPPIYGRDPRPRFALTLWGLINYRSPRLVSPGTSIPIRIRFTPRVNVEGDRVCMRLIAREVATSRVEGRGSAQTASRVHELVDQRWPLAAGQTFASGRPVDIASQVVVPETRAFSLTWPNSSVVWEARLEVAPQLGFASETVYALLMVPAAPG